LSILDDSIKLVVSVLVMQLALMVPFFVEKRTNVGYVLGWMLIKFCVISGIYYSSLNPQLCSGMELIQCCDETSTSPPWYRHSVSKPTKY